MPGPHVGALSFSSQQEAQSECISWDLRLLVFVLLLFLFFFPLAEVPGYAVFTHSWLSNHVPPPTAVGSGGVQNPTTPLSNIGGDLSVIPGKGGTGEHYFGMK